MIDEDHYLCIDCAKDKYLKRYIKKIGQDNKVCTICLEKKHALNIDDDPDITTFCRFLLRYHMPEYHYNPHWGGDDLPKPLMEENPIISHHYAEREEDDDIDYVEVFLDTLFQPWNHENPVDIYYGHDDTGRGLYAMAVKDERSRLWDTYKEKLVKKNYYLFEKEVMEAFRGIISDLEHLMKQGECFFRARIGYEEEERGLEFNTTMIKIPYSAEKISAPPILLANAGRANRQGVSYLYLGSDQETAIGEVRPHPGHYVSIAQFKSKKALSIADLRFIDLFKYFLDQQKLEQFRLLQALADELSVPIPPEHRENYNVTQFISDIIRDLGYDGIAFNSSISKGYNMVIFDPDNFHFIANSGELVKIKALKYKYAIVEYDKDYFMDRLKEK